ncbi:hypothetical protein IW261DRAFT_1665062 [Armillaria novae-zelandiae]|uniref:Glucose-methanol-choline oxidoreductase N-terminal domain-containing protein n=1 Tax=Armillaria novae-zelandiae TaxID=153914 RepID=A0AA39NV51_9AGAR|nr:hypothetical protein IW261DRAFT_1665062 [Armillaria novae-zelandiae]
MYQVDPTRKTHSSSGPIKVSFGGTTKMMEMAKHFLEIGPKFKKDWPESEEGNNLSSESVNHHYLYNSESKNLSMFDGTRVKRVIFEGTQAVGIKYVFDKQVYPDSEQTVHTVQASRLVVISAGAMGSSLILKRSGIGAASIWGKFSIKQVVDFPSMGKEYNGKSLDHPFLITPYIVDANMVTTEALSSKDPELWSELLHQWDTNGSGLMGGNGVEAAIKMCPRQDELKELGPDFQEYWERTLLTNQISLCFGQVPWGAFLVPIQAYLHSNSQLWAASLVSKPDLRVMMLHFKIQLEDKAIWFVRLLFMFATNTNKDVVWFIYALESAFTILSTIAAWHQYGPGWGDINSLLFFHWSWEVLPSLNGTISALVQTFYVWRIYNLTKIVWIPLLIELVAVEGHGVDKLLGLSAEISAWLAGSAACDVMITSTLVFVSNFSGTTSAVTKLIHFTVGTGLLTSAAAIVELIIWLTLPEYSIHLIG